MITKESIIEEIVNENPKLVNYLSEKGIRCIVCGEIIWGTVESVAKAKGWDDLEINCLIDDLNNIK